MSTLEPHRPQPDLQQIQDQVVTLLNSYFGDPGGYWPRREWHTDPERVKLTLSEDLTSVTIQITYPSQNQEGLSQPYAQAIPEILRVELEDRCIPSECTTRKFMDYGDYYYSGQITFSLARDQVISVLSDISLKKPSGYLDLILSQRDLLKQVDEWYDKHLPAGVSGDEVMKDDHDGSDISIASRHKQHALDGLRSSFQMARQAFVERNTASD